MTLGIGGATPQSELAKMTSLRGEAVPISVDEHLSRLCKLRGLIASENVDAFYLDATTNLRYFTVLACYPSKWLHGAIIIAEELFYVRPLLRKKKRVPAWLLKGILFSGRSMRTQLRLLLVVF